MVELSVEARAKAYLKCRAGQVGQELIEAEQDLGQYVNQRWSDRFWPWSRFRRVRSQYHQTLTQLNLLDLADQGLDKGDGRLAADLIDIDADQLVAKKGFDNYLLSLSSQPNLLMGVEKLPHPAVYQASLLNLADRSNQSALQDELVAGLRALSQHLRATTLSDSQVEKGLTGVRPLTT